MDFSGCVGGAKIANYGNPYDFDSIMQSSVYA